MQAGLNGLWFIIGREYLYHLVDGTLYFNIQQVESKPEMVWNRPTFKMTTGMPILVETDNPQPCMLAF